MFYSFCHCTMRRVFFRGESRGRESTDIFRFVQLLLKYSFLGQVLIFNFLQVVLLSSKIADGCVEGFGFTGGSCQPCQPGYYNDAADDSQCQECPTGKNTVHMNSTACG